MSDEFAALDAPAAPKDEFAALDEPRGSSTLKAIGEAATAIPRYARAGLVGIENLATGEGLAKSAERTEAAKEPGFQPEGIGEKVAGGAGYLAGTAPAIAAAGTVAAAAIPLGAEAGLAATTGVNVARGALAFGALSPLQHAAEKAALTGQLPTAQEAAVKAGGGLMFGGAMGAAGMVPALVAGRLSPSITQALGRELAPRIFGAAAEAGVGGVAAAAEGGKKEDVALNTALYGLAGMMGNEAYDAQYKSAALNSAIKPTVDDMVASGMPRPAAQAQATEALKNLMVDKVRAHPDYEHAVQIVTDQLTAAHPDMPKEQADILARQQMDALASTGSLAKIDEIARLGLRKAPPEAEKGGGELPAPEGPAPIEPAAGPEKPPAAPLPNTGDLVVMPGEGWEMEGRVTSVNPETGEATFQIGRTRGTNLPSETGDSVSVPASMLKTVAAESGPSDQSSAGDLASPATSISPALPAQSGMGPAAIPSLPYDASITDHPIFVKAQAEAAPVLNAAGINPSDIPATIGFYQKIHGQMHDLLDEAKAGPAPERLAQIAAQMNELGAKEVALIRYAHILSEPKPWLELYEKRGQGKMDTPVPTNVMEHFLSGGAGAPPPPPGTLTPGGAADDGGIEPGSQTERPSLIAQRLTAAIGRVEKLQQALAGTTDPQERYKAEQRLQKAIIERNDLKKAMRAEGERTDITSPEGKKTKAATERSTGINPDEKTVQIAQSELLRLKLLNQQRGSLVAERATYRKTYTELMGKFKAGQMTKQLLTTFAREGLRGLKISSTEMGRIMGTINAAKDDEGLMKAMQVLHEVTATNYKRSRIAEFWQIVGRTADSPGIEVGWRQKLRDLRDQYRKNTPLSKIHEAALLDMYLQHAKQFGKEDSLPAYLFEQAAVLSRRPIASLSEAELDELVDTAQAVEHGGRLAQKFKAMAWQYQVARLTDKLTSQISPLERLQAPANTPGMPANREAYIRTAARGTVNFLNDLYNPLNMPYALMDLLDGGNAGLGPHSQEIYQVVNSAFRRASNNASPSINRLLAAQEETGLKMHQEERVAMRFIADQEGGLRRLAGIEGLPKDPKKLKAYTDAIKLTPAEQKAYDAVRREIDDNSKFEATAELVRRLENREVKKVRGVYFPFTGVAETTADARPMVDTLTDELNNNTEYARKSVQAGHTQSRVGSDKGLNLSLWDTAIRHIQRREYYLEMAEPIKRIGEAVNQGRYERAAGAEGTKLVRDWVSMVARAGGVDGLAKWRVATLLRANVGAYQLGMNLQSILLQATHYPLVVGEVGVGRALEGLALAATPKWRDFMLKHSAEWRDNVESEKIFQGIARNPQSLPGQAMKTAQRAAFFAHIQMNRQFMGAAIISGYLSSLDERGLTMDFENPDPAAIAAGADAAVRALGSPLPHQMSLALSTNALTGVRELNRMVLQYESFKIVRWNYFMHHVVRNGLRQGNYASAAWHASILASAMGMDMGIKYGAKKLLGLALLGAAGAAAASSDSWKKKITEEGLENIPFVSKIYQAAKYGEVPIPVVQSAIQAAVGTVGVMSGQDIHYHHLSSTVNALQGLAALAGIPAGALIIKAGRSMEAPAGHIKPQRGISGVRPVKPR